MIIQKTAAIKRPALLLASSSRYRAQVLAKLQVKFDQATPNIEETPKINESSEELVVRLSEQKAIALTKEFAEHIIIGSDQVAVSPTGHILGKSLNRANAIQQLSQLSGHKVVFVTGLCVLTPVSKIHSGFINQQAIAPISFAHSPKQQWIKQTIVEPFAVYFKTLTATQIENYIDKDQPFDCAGSFKSEGLGISLFEKLEGDDPNSLIGLPLIQLCKLLGNVGIDILD